MGVCTSGTGDLYQLTESHIWPTMKGNTNNIGICLSGRIVYTNNGIKLISTMWSKY